MKFLKIPTAGVLLITCCQRHSIYSQIKHNDDYWTIAFYMIHFFKKIIIISTYAHVMVCHFRFFLIKKILLLICGGIQILRIRWQTHNYCRPFSKYYSLYWRGYKLKRWTTLELFHTVYYEHTIFFTYHFTRYYYKCQLK